MEAYLKWNCEVVKGGTRLPHSFTCWSGRRRYVVKLKPDPRSDREYLHLPHRDLLSYLGQSLFCFKCGLEGHSRENCAGPRFRFCGASDHSSASCMAPKTCSLCREEGHLFARCPSRRASYADIVTLELPGRHGGKHGRRASSAGQSAGAPHGRVAAPEGPCWLLMVLEWREMRQRQ